MNVPRFCLFVLFFVLNIAVQFGDGEDTTNSTVNCDEKISSDSEKETYLSSIEKNLTFNEQFANYTKEIINSLEKVSIKSFSSIINKFIPQIHLIFPGTLWCGNGDKANSEDDLGKFNETDACCREHDNCSNSLSAGKALVNIKNNGIFTRSACTCDRTFYKCLKDVNSILSTEMGKTYFNILGPQCFTCECPTDNCNASTNNSECKNQCNRYKWVKSDSF